LLGTVLVLVSVVLITTGKGRQPAPQPAAESAAGALES
jgi:hypothetical protein